MDQNILIQVHDVKKYFGATKAVDGISIEINHGEFVALLGPNGAGKTTTVEMIEGIQFPESGSITINGLNWKSHSKKLRNIIGLSLQETHFIEKLRVDETLDLFSSFYDLPNTRMEEVLDMVDLTSKRKTYTKNLSGGQKQKLALAIAFLNRPEVLLLDEPTTGLDPTARREIWNILLAMRKQHNTALILTTHYMEEASFLCDRIIIIDKGKVLAKGTLDELLAKYKNGELIKFSVNKAIDINKLNQLGRHINIELSDDNKHGEIIVESLVEYMPALLHLIESSNLTMTSIECRKMTLDDLFISMTGRHLTE